MIKMENVMYKYKDNTVALNNINFDLDKGNIIGLIGSNGAGKTTLILNCVGLLKPNKGNITFNKKELKYNKKFLLNLRNHVGVVFQDPDRQIFYSKVYDDIAFGPRNLGLNESEVKKRVDYALKMVNAEKFKDKPVHFLSHGQKKRVAIAGVLAMDNDVIFFDEPTAGLDPDITEKMIALLKRISNEGKKLVISSHDMDLIYNLCDYSYVLNEGEIIGSDKTNKIFLKEDLINKAKLKQPWLVRLHKNLNIPLFKSEKALYSFFNQRSESFFS
ncbi:MAG: ATP-binding cassette domain-containing protein [Firmicutes bacterium]|nr:ATP-binding cassette domain-containing protein [Bacillota bacterium]